MDAHGGAGLVEQVDGFVGQVTVLNVALRQAHRGLDGLGRVMHAMVLLIAGAQAFDDVEGLVARGLPHLDGLEATREGRVLLDVLAVLVGRGGADDLNLTARQRRLQDGGRVERALGRTRADEGVQLVDEQDDGLVLHDLGDDALEAVLEVTAVLGAGHEGGHVERPDVAAAEHLRDVAGDDALRQALDDGRLADAGLADEQRVVLGAASQDLHDALGLVVAADDGVELALAGKLREVAAVLAKGGTLLVLSLLRAEAHGQAHASRNAGQRRRRALGGELGHGGTHRVGRDAHARERLHGHAVALAQDAQQQVLGGDVGLAHLHHLAQGRLEHALGTRGVGDVAGRRGLLGLLGNLLNLLGGLVIRDVELAQGLGGNAVLLADETEKDVLGAHVELAVLMCFFLGKVHDLASAVSELLKHGAPPLRLVCARYLNDCA